MSRSTAGLGCWWVPFLAATVVWAAVIPLAAFAASRPADWRLTHLTAALPYTIGAVVCHQEASRSFALWSRQLPVCARCTGIYVGAALMVVAASTFRRARTLPEVAQGFSPARTMLILAALPTAATLLYQWTTGITPSNTIRAIAGFVLGAAVARVILAALDDQVN